MTLSTNSTPSDQAHGEDSGSTSAEAGPSVRDVLIVDDDAAVRDTLARVLRSEGFAAQTADSGVRALEALNAGARMDVVVTDLWMPQLNGLEFARRVWESRPDLEVVLLTAHATPATEDRSRELGMYAVLRKGHADMGAVVRIIARAAESRRRQRLAEGGAPAEDSSGGALSILLADDDDGFVAPLREVLEESGAMVVRETNGRSAFAAAVARDFDVALVDVHMPHGDGVTLARWLKDADPQLLIIVVTGEATEDETRQLRELGVADFFTKPFKYDALLDRIRAHPVDQAREERAKRVRLQRVELEESYEHMDNLVGRVGPLPARMSRRKGRRLLLVFLVVVAALALVLMFTVLDLRLRDLIEAIRRDWGR